MRRRRKTMRIEDAIEIVMSLARENVLEERQCDDEQMVADRLEQLEAIGTVEDFFTNVVFR